MATRTANVMARVEPDVKEQAEGILEYSLRYSGICCNQRSV